MKTIGNQQGLGQVLDDGGGVGRAQIGGHGLDSSLGQAQLAEKGHKRVFAPSLGDMEHSTALPIDGQRDELVQPTQIYLVDGQKFHSGKVDGGDFPFHVPAEDAFDGIPAKPGKPLYILQAHHSAESCNISFKAMSVGSPSGGKRGARSKFSPHSRHWHLGIAATITTDFIPMGTLWIWRSRLPLNPICSAPHCGHRILSRRARMFSSIPPLTYFVLRYSQSSPIPNIRFKNVASILSL